MYGRDSFGESGSLDRLQLKSARFTRVRFQNWMDQEFEVTAYGSLVSTRATLVAIQGTEGEFVVLFRGSDLPTGLCGVAHRSGEHFSVFLEAASGPLRLAMLRAERRATDRGISAGAADQGAGRAAIVANGSPTKIP
jgi:hypothetical protein